MIEIGGVSINYTEALLGAVAMGAAIYAAAKAWAREAAITVAKYAAVAATFLAAALLKIT